MVLETRSDANQVVVQDTAVAVGETPPQAIEAALRGWQEGVLSVLRDAFGSHNSEAPFGFSTRNEATGEVSSWDVFSGPFQVIGPQREQLQARLEETLPFTLLIDQLTDAVERRRPYWIKLFVLSQPADPLSIDCRLNNDLWAAGSEALLTFVFPLAEEVQAFRQFLALRPVEDDKYAQHLPTQANRPWWKFW